MLRKTPLLVAALLTWVAGFVDAVGFISLGHVYTANMSGNSVGVGIEISARSWFEMVRHLWPVLIYVTGLIFCRIFLEFGARERIRSAAALVFAAEIALLVPVCLIGFPPPTGSPQLPLLDVALLALAMGAQNGALTRFSSLTLHTGFVTGTLLKFAEQFAKYLTELFDRVRGGEVLGNVLSASWKNQPFRVSVFLAGIYAAYILGAVCGGFSDHVFRLKALMMPVVCLLALIALDLKRPLAVQDEARQVHHRQIES